MRKFRQPCSSPCRGARSTCLISSHSFAGAWAPSRIPTGCPHRFRCLVIYHRSQMRRTRTVFKDRNPQFDEFFEMGNLQSGTVLAAEVRDVAGQRARLSAVHGAAPWVLKLSPACLSCRHLLCSVLHL